MYDAVIVGARCAGASTALLLARSGYRVLLADRSAFPSDTMSTLYIQQSGVAGLARWGLTDALTATGCPRLDTISYQVADVRLESPIPAADGADTAFAPRRLILDQLLVDAAVAAGAEFVDRASLRELLWQDGAVAGARFRTGTGSTLTARARLVIGADGMRSQVARLVSAPMLTRDPLASCVYYTCWSGFSTTFGFYERPGSWVAKIPTHDGATMVATYFPQERFAELRRGGAAAAHLEAVRATAPDLHEQLQQGEQTDRMRGTGDQQNFFRQACGPGWALVGDAGHHLDTITARGITNAFIQAELLSEAIGDSLADPRRLAAALARFARERDAALHDGYRSTLEVAKLHITPSRLRMLRAISRSAASTSRYFAVIAGLMDMEDLWDQELLDQL